MNAGHSHSTTGHVEGLEKLSSFRAELSAKGRSYSEELFEVVVREKWTVSLATSGFKEMLSQHVVEMIC